MTENPIVKQLHEIASRLTGDPDVQGDLMHEMYLHLVRVRTIDPDRAPSWYQNSCEFHARNFLKLDGHASSSNGEPNDAPAHEGMPVDHGHRGGDRHASSPLVGQIEIQGELITSDVLNLVLPQLSDKQQQVLFLLMKGCGVREAGRVLGISHPAIIKHRKKIARIARRVLCESEGIGVTVCVHEGAKENGIGDANGNGEAHTA